MVFLVALVVAALSWWLGLYLLARDIHKAPLRRAGAGLLAYALVLMCDMLSTVGTYEARSVLGRMAVLLIVVPALCWSGALLALLPDEVRFRDRLERWWRWGVVPVNLLLAVAAFVGVLDTRGFVGVGGGLVALALTGAFVVLLWVHRTVQPSPVRQMLVVATLFFGLGLGLLVAPFGWLPRLLVLLAIGMDLMLLGLAVAIWDAFDEGQTLRHEMVRSVIGATGAALLFGGQVLLAMRLTRTPDGLMPLLFTTVGAAIGAHVFNLPLQRWLDGLAFRDALVLQDARADLLTAVEVVPRTHEALDPLTLDDDEFARLTRRALSHYSDLPRLASNPLTQLPTVLQRLTVRGAPNHPLERAAELRALLNESIARLRPQGDMPFGTTEAWRHYNALYFPYVVGLRPYRRRAIHGELDPVERQAFDWFATMIPERTLHNWQNAAARLVAEDIRALHR